MMFKVLDPHRKARMGTGTWPAPKGGKPGRWLPRLDADRLEPCVYGYHLCRNTTDLLGWLGPEIWVAEGRGARVDANDKAVFQQARLIERVDGWNERSARLFAADCAERVLPIFEDQCPDDSRPREAIETARKFARGDATSEQLSAAQAAGWAAAWDAAWAAAWDAARDAARAAGWAAAQAAAWDAAWAAAWDAAQAAAQDAARDAAQDAAQDAAEDAAERGWQQAHLAGLLGLASP